MSRDATSQAFAGIVFGVVIAAYAATWLGLSREAPGERPRTDCRGVLRAGGFTVIAAVADDA